MTNWEKWLKENKKVSDYAILCNFYFDKRECPLADSEKGCKGCNEDKFNKWANAEEKQTNTAEWIDDNGITYCSNCKYEVWGSGLSVLSEWKHCPCCGRKIAE